MSYSWNPLSPAAPEISTCEFSRLISIHLLKECWENLKKDQRIIPFDHFLNSHTLFSQWCIITVRRKLMLVTFGSERVKLAENRSLRPRALVSSLPKPCSALMLREGRLAAGVFAALGSEIGGVAVSHVSSSRLSPRLATNRPLGERSERFRPRSGRPSDEVARDPAPY